MGVDVGAIVAVAATVGGSSVEIDTLGGTSVGRTKTLVAVGLFAAVAGVPQDVNRMARAIIRKISFFKTASLTVKCFGNQS